MVGQWWTLVPRTVILTVVTVDLDAIADALAADDERPFGRYGLRCKTCRLLHQLPPPGTDDRGDLIRAYVDGPVEAETVVRRLKAAGVDIGGDSLRRHRRGDCKTRRKVATDG